MRFTIRLNGSESGEVLECEANELIEKVKEKFEIQTETPKFFSSTGDLLHLTAIRDGDIVYVAKSDENFINPQANSRAQAFRQFCEQKKRERESFFSKPSKKKKVVNKEQSCKISIGLMEFKTYAKKKIAPVKKLVQKKQVGQSMIISVQVEKTEPPETILERALAAFRTMDPALENIKKFHLIYPDLITEVKTLPKSSEQFTPEGYARLLEKPYSRLRLYVVSEVDWRAAYIERTKYAPLSDSSEDEKTNENVSRTCTTVSGNQCRICLQNISPQEKTAQPNRCKDIFHLPCIAEWLKVGDGVSYCPTCNEEFDDIIDCSPQQVKNHDRSNNGGKETTFDEYLLDDGEGSNRIDNERSNIFGTLDGYTDLDINRNTVLEQLLSSYGDKEHDITKTKLHVSFHQEPALDADGLTREIFSIAWEKIIPKYFEGTTFYTPRVDPDCTEDLFEVLGRITSHGFVLTGFFPVLIAPAVFISTFDNFALTDSDLMYSFVSFLTEAEKLEVERLMESTKVQVTDTILDVLGRFNVHQIPCTVSDMQSLFLDISKCEFSVKPNMLMSSFKKGMERAHPTIWQALTATEIRYLYAKLEPTTAKVMELINPSDDQQMNKTRERVFEYLRRYIRSLQREKLKGFLQFVTGSTLVLSSKIEVSFTSLTGLQRRPIAHTCVNRIDISTAYESYAAFAREFDSVLSKDECFHYSSI